jgi:hypothetical protein
MDVPVSPKEQNSSPTMRGAFKLEGGLGADQES